jgi:hypothetical protein
MIVFIILENFATNLILVRVLKVAFDFCFRRVTEAVYGRAGFRYGWKKQNKMHQKKLHFYCVLKVLTDPPMVLCRPYRSLVRSLRRL